MFQAFVTVLILAAVIGGILYVRSKRSAPKPGGGGGGGGSVPGRSVQR